MPSLRCAHSLRYAAHNKNTCASKFYTKLQNLCYFYSCPFFQLIFVPFICPPNPSFYQHPMKSSLILQDSWNPSLHWAWAFFSSGPSQEILARGRDQSFTHLPDYQIRVIFFLRSLRWKPHAAPRGYSLIWLPLTAQRQVSSHAPVQKRMSKFETGLQVSSVSTPVFSTDLMKLQKSCALLNFVPLSIKCLHKWGVA